MRAQRLDQMKRAYCKYLEALGSSAGGDGGGGDQPADAPPPVEAGRQGLGLAGSVGPGEGGRCGGQAHGLTAVVERGPSRRRAIPMGGDAA